MTKYIKGKIVKAVVSGIENYGIFVKVDDQYSGLIHISEISDSYVRNICDYTNIGDTIYTKVLDINEETHQLKLSIKNIPYKTGVKTQKRKIIETSLGFSTLERNLPRWIEENIKKNKKQINSIDK